MTRIHRASAVVAGAFVGLAGVFSLVAPAGASSAGLSATTSCFDRGWKVSWKLVNGGVDGVLGKVESKVVKIQTPPGIGSQGNAPVRPTLPAMAVLADGVQVAGGQVVTASQDVRLEYLEVELKATVTWGSGASAVTRDVAATAVKPAGCTTIPPIAEATPPHLPPDFPPPLPTGDDPDGFPPPPEDTEGEPPIGLPTPGDDTAEEDPGSEGENPAEEPAAGSDDAGEVPPAETAAPSPAQATTPAAVEVAAVSGGGDDDLPLTGAAVGSIAAGSALLLGVGVALFVVSRRRRVKFTA